MQDKTVIEKLFQRYLEARRKVYLNMEELFKLLREDPLDRAELTKTLAYLRADIVELIELINTIEEKFVSRIKSMIQDPQTLKKLSQSLVFILLVLLVLSESARSLKYLLDQHIINIKLIINKIPQQYPLRGYIYSDNDIRQELYNELALLLEHFSKINVKIESEIYRRGYTIISHRHVTSTLEFITFYVNDWPGVDIKWMSAAIYLATLEVSVNKICSELDIKSDTFKDKLNKLVEKMRLQGIEISRIEKDIVTRLYDYRNKVLHGGYMPTDDELNYIISVVPKFIQSIKDFRRKNLVL